MAAELDEAVEAFRTRPFDAGPYTFVAADALVLKVRENGRVIGVHTLIASGVNAAKAVGTLGQCPQMSVGGLRQGVGQAVVEGVPDEVTVAADAAGQGDELGDARVRRPRQPPGQQLAAACAFDPIDLAQLLAEGLASDEQF